MTQRAFDFMAPRWGRTIRLAGILDRGLSPALWGGPPCGVVAMIRLRSALASTYPDSTESSTAAPRPLINYPGVTTRSLAG
jgi:hypothetical protein